MDVNNQINSVQSSLVITLKMHVNIIMLYADKNEIHVWIIVTPVHGSTLHGTKMIFNVDKTSRRLR